MELLNTLAEAITNQYIASLLILIVAVLFFYRNAITKLITPSKKEEREVITDLLDHDIFSTLERAVIEVNNSKFYTDGKFDSTKTKMCSDFAAFKTRHIKNGVINMITQNDLQNMSPDKLKRLVITLQNQWHIEYCKELGEHWREKGIPEPSIIYIVSMFEKFRYDVVASFDHRINSIFGSTFHQGNFELVLAVLEMWAMGIDLLPRDMKTTFEALNGKFKEINY